MADVPIPAPARIRNDSRFGWSPLTESALVATIAGLILLGLSRFDMTIYNNYVVLADAFLHGHVWIDWPGGRIDALNYNGAYYIIEGPIPAIILLPFVAIFGQHTNQTSFTCVFGAIALGGAWHLARMQLPQRRDNAALLVAFFAFGTDLAWCCIYGAVWFTAHVVADAFVFLALVEVFGRKRPWLILYLLLMAAGSRFALVLAAPPLVLYALSYVPRQKLVRALGYCAAVLIPFVVAYVAYNYARWGVPNDIGYTQWYHGDQIGEPTGSPFRFEYIPYELESFFLDFPNYIGRYPWIVIGYSSVPLTLTSPALVVAFFAGGNRRLIGALAAAAFLCFVPNVMYYANGGSQFGMRHALDFEPFLFALMVMAVATKRVPQLLVDILCGISIVVGIWGIWFWRTFYDKMLNHLIPGVNS